MKIGDYVRTPKGITEIINIIDEIIRNSANGNEIVLETRKYITDNDFSVSNDYESSPNIIDLIEVGDYVNGVIVTQSYIDNIKNIAPKIKENNYGIKTIVTKEQFEAMKYEIK